MENKKRKICVVTGNRSDYVKVLSVLKHIKNNPKLELSLVVTASHLLKNYGESIKNIQKEGFKVDFIARTILEGEDLVSMAKSVGLGALELPTIFENIKPDIVLIVGDRFDIFPVAIVSALMNIPLAHIQGGEITGTIDESIRHAITKLAHIHFPSTEKAKERIIKMGENPDYVFNVGCPSYDLFNSLTNKPKEDLCKTEEDYKIHINPQEPYLILMQHPVTTEFPHAGEQMYSTLKAVAKTGIQTAMFYPNVDAGNSDMIKIIRNAQSDLDLSKFSMYKNMSVKDFLNLLKHAACIVGNSSSGIREACYFGTPAINIGTRQNGRERAENVTDVASNEEEIYQAIMNAIKKGKYPSSNLYGDGKSGERIATILAEINLSSIIQKRFRE